MLLPIFAIVLHRVVKGTNFKFVFQTIVLLIISNIADLFFAYSSGFHIKDNSLLQIGLNSSMAFLKDFSFNEANWIFAFRYFTISRAMPYCLKNEAVPNELL